MLHAQHAIAFVPVTDIDRAMHFYADVLNLPIIDRGEQHCSFEAGGVTLRLTVVSDHPQASHTVIGWSVTSVDEAAAELTHSGVRFLRYDGIDQGDNGVWKAPNGDRVAWFCDPDGNTLSITQFAQVPATATA